MNTEIAERDIATNHSDESGRYRMLILREWEQDWELTLTDEKGEAFVTTDVLSAQDLVEGRE